MGLAPCALSDVSLIELAMLPRRSLVPILLAVSLAACATGHPRPGTETPEITFDLVASPPHAREQLTAAFAANGLTVATSQPGVVEFHAPRERGILGYYEVFARAVLVPMECGTRVTMFGEETRYPNASSNEGTPTRIGPSSRGRALEVWTKLQRVAGSLRTDSARVRTDR